MKPLPHVAIRRPRQVAALFLPPGASREVPAPGGRSARAAAAGNTEPHAGPAPRHVAYCDGSCSPQVGAAGWGIRVERPDGAALEKSGTLASAKSGDAEMYAAIQVLKHTDARMPLAVHCDCRFVVDAVAQMQGRRHRRAKVREQGLYHSLRELVQSRDVRFHWVPGHAGVQGNMRVDRLARRAMREFAARLTACDAGEHRLAPA